MFLVDTSAWISHFSKSDPFNLYDIAAPEQIVITLPIYQEILQGLRDKASFLKVKKLLTACPILDSPLPRKRFDEAAELYRIGRKRGITIRSSVDCLIAATAIRYGLPVVHRNRDYPAIASFSGLAEIEV